MGGGMVTIIPVEEEKEKKDNCELFSVNTVIYSFNYSAIIYSLSTIQQANENKQLILAE